MRIGVSPQAVVSPTAKIGANVDIHPGATIGNGDVQITGPNGYSQPGTLSNIAPAGTGKSSLAGSVDG